jgi:4-hydroxybenzoate polyprenyltransferase
MTMSTRKRAKILGMLTILTVSSAIMLWSFWHYPVGTGIATAAVLLAFGILVRLARAIETDVPPPAQGEQGA